ncbi:MAG: methylenetetrahydrofolate reductase C-terminal domain-containing protein [Chloroflexia bacterium]|nr:methylenetetrahydrofolate reductase C-terminal domain-containing protein [Chloroflexia bacterium]
MIVGEQKPLEEIRKLVAGHKKILILGCGTCVTVCFAGGEKEVGILASSLRMAEQLAGNQVEIQENTVQRQCEWEYLDPIAEQIQEADVVVSLACGIGVQAIAQRFEDVWVVPGLNTTFLGLPEEEGLWTEQCQACGDCVLGLTGGICPIARCSKSLLNGPCGGSQGGKCEIDETVDCAWQLIYDRLSRLGKLDLLMEIQPLKDWSTSRDGGPRRIDRPDLRLEEE